MTTRARSEQHDRRAHEEDASAEDAHDVPTRKDTAPLTLTKEEKRRHKRGLVRVDGRTTRGAEHEARKPREQQRAHRDKDEA